MQKITYVILILFFNNHLFAQTPNFEGIIDYSTSIKGKSVNIDDKDIRISLLEPEKTTVTIRQGNYRYVSDFRDMWSISSDKKMYYRFRGIDTLYFTDFNDDTSNVLGSEKGPEVKKIAGYDCKRITINVTTGTQEYYYAPDLYNDPEYERENRIGRIDAFARETSSIWLSQKVENEDYSLTRTATRVELRKISDTSFVLPSLPVKKFTNAAVIKEPVFSRPGGWKKYISMNVNPDIGVKYLKIPRKETSASQTVQVEFMISKEGKVINAKVINRDQVHPKLAEEALRVITSSPNWKPATFLGEKTLFYYKQPLTFSVTK
jgi:Gram-negative bacterial TonB protein C-terminal